MSARPPADTRALAALLVAVGLLAAAAPEAQARREFTVEGRRCAFVVTGDDRQPPRIGVTTDDLVHIAFSAADAPHSFVIDAPYRIAKRAEPGKPVGFDLAATQAGTFAFYSNLSDDAGCPRRMEGQLVVKAKGPRR